MGRRLLWRMFVRDLFLGSFFWVGQKRGREDSAEIIAMGTGMDDPRDVFFLMSTREDSQQALACRQVDRHY